jgi:lipoprotein-anchoring transpeptidase ErfK/SrfK
MPRFSRRSLLLGGGASLAAGGLAGCGPRQPLALGVPEAYAEAGDHAGPPDWVEAPPSYRHIAAARGNYGPVPGEPFPVPAAPLSRINPAFLRARVSYLSNERPGTIVIDPRARYLYYVEGGGSAMRYGVGVGREGFGWAGMATIEDKQEWPDWYPPKEMVQRQPELRRQLAELQSGLGVPGGPRNPLGARAMYLWQNGKDTLYRIHGTLEPWTIGTSVSSGCIRMINQDVIDLYERTELGTKVVVLGSGRGAFS